MVRVLAVADEVVASIQDARVRELEPDVVVAAGDLPWDYLEFLSSCLDVPVVFVPGNHDPAVVPPRPLGATNIDETVIKVAGLRIAGLGGCVRYSDGPNQYTQREYVRRAKRLMRRERRASGDGVDILLTHAPPSGLGDEDDLAHLGIEALHGVLEVFRPTWHLHGHIHPYGHPKGDRKVGRTTIRNIIPCQVIDIVPAATPEVEEAHRGS